MDTKNSPTIPEKIAQAGEQIYDERYRKDYEARYPGQFVAIDTTTGAAYPAQFPELALESAKKASPHGVFHLIKVGSPGAYKVSYNYDGDRDGLFR